MKKSKRFMSGALATIMIAAALMTNAAAKSYDDVETGSKHAEQIEILSDIGVIKGTTETEFSPEKDVTREQMALLLFRLMLGKDSAGAVNTTAFTDLYDPTYNGAISWANASGFIRGTSNTTFAPREGITLQDAMAMLVRALGHDSANMNGGYPWSYIDAAVKLDLDQNLEDIPYTKELSRAEVASLLYNALTAEYLIPRTAPNGMTFYESTTIIERVFGYEINEAVIVATNHYALDGVDTVTKDGYVTVHTDKGFITVKFEELGLEGAADSHFGKNLKLVYKIDEKTKLVNVLGCTEVSKTESVSTITFGKDNSFVEIGGTKYQVVETLSDALATNANEILVYTYTKSGTLTKLTSNEQLAALTGAFDAKLIYNDKNSATADRLIIKPFAFGKLAISGGKINLADNMKAEDLTVINPDNAKNGSHVLYFFNEANKTLELSAVLPVLEAGTVSKLTDTTATIGGAVYKLGCEKLGVSAESIRSLLTVGQTTKIVVYGDMIMALEATEASALAQSEYLVARSETTPAFVNGKLQYVMDVIIDGSVKTIAVTNRSVTAGNVYRYTIDETGTYTLIARSEAGGLILSGSDKFVQSDSVNDEIAFHIGSADSSEITKTSSHFTLSAGSADAIASHMENADEIKFITTDKTTIIVNNNGTISVVNGIFDAALNIEDGAAVTAIFDNEVGSIESLRFMYISNGSFGGVDVTAHSVKVLESIGKELVDGQVYSIYRVLDIHTGKISEMRSTEASLTTGKNYLTNVDGLITSSEASVTNGVITGFTKSTITIGGETYKLASDIMINILNDDATVTAASIAEIFMNNVEYITSNGTVTSIVSLGKAAFSASYEAGEITISAVSSIRDDAECTLTKLFKVADEELVEIDTSEAEIENLPVDNFSACITLAEALEAGEYSLSFKVNGIDFTVDFTVE